MARVLKPKPAYLAVPFGNQMSQYRIFKCVRIGDDGKAFEVESSYVVDPDGICQCKGSERGECRHAKMLRGEFYYTRSNQKPYKMAYAVANDFAKSLAKKIGARRWSPVGEFRGTETEIVKRIDMVCDMDTALYDNSQIIGFLVAGDTGITSRVIVAHRDTFKIMVEMYTKGGLK
jgi:hypothetical protein